MENSFKTYTSTSIEKREIITFIKNALQKHDEIIFAYIYGSFIDPEMPFFRDIDIGVYVNEEKVSSKQFIDYALNLSSDIELLLKRYPVDVVVMNNSPLSLTFRITQGELLFTKKEDTWTNFITKTWSLYHDHAISSRNILVEILKP
ncbi:MAG: nucleotidyltransferase domain-containing protein [Nitrospira sp.]|jgi:hypothetical protein|nr:nucleotidyltransferase domain-containing protein [Nitrospira sp.]